MDVNGPCFQGSPSLLAAAQGHPRARARPPSPDAGLAATPSLSHTTRGTRHTDRGAQACEGTRDSLENQPSHQGGHFYWEEKEPREIFVPRRNWALLARIRLRAKVTITFQAKSNNQIGESPLPLGNCENAPVLGTVSAGIGPSFPNWLLASLFPFETGKCFSLWADRKSTWLWM